MIKQCKRCRKEFETTIGGNNYCSIECRFWDKVQIGEKNDCWIWKGCIVKDGYGMFHLAKQKNITASRFSWQLAFGDIPKGLHVLHNCPGGDNPACVNPNHLWLGTDDDNAKDKARKGRSARHIGALNSMTKLTAEQVAEIKRLRRSGMYPVVIAPMFGISPGHIANIMNGNCWNYIP